MRKVLLFSLILLAGMVGAQLLPSGGSGAAAVIGHGLEILTMMALAFIMIHVGMSSSWTRRSSAGTAGTTSWR